MQRNEEEGKCVNGEMEIIEMRTQEKLKDESKKETSVKQKIV